MFSIREGQPCQAEMSLTVEWTTEVVPPEPPFIIRARNTVAFGGKNIEVLNDAMDLGDARLHASAPSASEYLEAAASALPTLIKFECVRDPHLSTKHGVPIYRTTRTFIRLP